MSHNTIRPHYPQYCKDKYTEIASPYMFKSSKLLAYEWINKQYCEPIMSNAGVIPDK